MTSSGLATGTIQWRDDVAGIQVYGAIKSVANGRVWIDTES